MDSEVSDSPSAIITFLSLLPEELILAILSYLDVPDLLAISRTTHHLRLLSLDPILHMARLARASETIERYIPVRPSLAELMGQRIYVTRTTMAARSLGRSLIKIKLNRSLLKRPSAETLVEKGVLPSECIYGGKRHGRGSGWVAPSLIETKRRVERERVKDVLRHWVEERRRKGPPQDKAVDVEERPDVRILVRRFAKRNGGGNAERETRWGMPSVSRERMEMPTRAKVLGLRRFWEKVGRDS